MKKLCAILSSFALVAGIGLSIPMTEQTVKADAIQNNAYYITATGNEEDGGNSLVYTQGTGDVEISFDMLKDVDFGYFGVVFTFETGIKNFLNRDNYTLFGADGTQVKSSSLAESTDFTFEEGNAYKISFSKSQKSLTISERDLGATTEYETKYSTAIKAGASGVCGLAVMTENARSATVVIDNLSIIENGKSIVESDFNQSESNLTLVSSHEGGYAGIYDKPKYRVAFVDEEGTLLQESYVCQYNYAICENIPDVEGKVFSHWSESVISIQKDLVVYPVYVTGNKPITPPDSGSDDSSSNEDSATDSSQDSTSNSDNESSSDTQTSTGSDKESGCRSAIGLSSVGLGLIAVAYMVIRKKEERQ